MGFPSTRVRSALLLSFSHAYIYSAESSRTSFDKMSDAEGDAPAPVEPTGPMDVGTALQEVLKTAAIHDGLARGLNEAVRAEHNIALLKVEDNKKLGEWSGLCKIDQEGKPRKVVGCSCVVIRDYGKEGQAHDVL